MLGGNQLGTIVHSRPKIIVSGATAWMDADRKSLVSSILRLKIVLISIGALGAFLLLASELRPSLISRNQAESLSHIVGELPFFHMVSNNLRKDYNSLWLTLLDREA
jgi:hypothetical protein